MDCTTQVKDRPERPQDFLLSHKGDLTLAISALLYIGAWIALKFTPWKTGAEIGVTMAEASLIGGLCDYIALKMIFEQRWYLPNSGVLPRNRQRLIDGIAATIENEWLTPKMIGDRLNQMNLVERLGGYLKDVRLQNILGAHGLEQILNRIIEYLESPEAHDRLEVILRKALPKTFARVYAVANRLGVETLSTQMVANLRRRLPELRSDLELAETIESAIHELGHQLQQPDSYAYRLAHRIIDEIVRRAVASSRGEISAMVRENLDRLSNEQIKVQIETRTRHHLDWIRVNGGIFGAFFGLLFALARVVLHHGPFWLAHLHGR